MKKRGNFFLFLGIVLLITIAVFSIISFNKSKSLKVPIATFSSDIQKCNSVETNLRFSCYRATIEKYFIGNVPGFLDELKKKHALSFEASYADNGKISYAIFGTNCHTFYHAAGDFVATYSKDDLKKMVDEGPQTCTSGYIMGVYKRVALVNHYDENVIKQFWTGCKKGSENQCAHEIGHVLHDKYFYSVLQTLDGISLDKYHLSYPQKYQYVTFANNDYKTDLDKPFEDCKKLMPDQNKLAQCYTGIGHNLFLYSEFAKGDYKSIFSECSAVSQSNKDNCYAFLVYRIGINTAATQFLSHDFEQGNKVCADVVALSGRPELMEHCYRGIGGGIGLFVDSEYALTDINDKNLDVIKSQLTDYLKLCEKSDPKYVNSCFAGLFGTKFAKYYDLLKIFYEPIEKLRPTWDTDFEVVG